MPAAPSRLLTLPFVVAAVVLLAAVIGLQPGIAALDEHYRKESIDLRRPLKSFDAVSLPSFAPAGADVSWDSIGDPGALDLLTRAYEVREAPSEGGAVKSVLLFVTYYSDPRDRVGHTPEVCYRQDGAVISDISSRPIELVHADGTTTAVDARVLDVDNHGRRMAVSYVFCCNGRFYHDREQVRMAIGWPGDRYTYFSKIEAVAYCLRDDDFDEAAALTCRLLAEATPVLLADYLPTREAVRGR